MKKNLVLLTGIVFVLTILLACNRKPDENQEVTDPLVPTPQLVAKDPTQVDIFLKETLVDTTMHLFISDSKKPDCGVIDDHLIVVKRGYTIRWKNAQGSSIHKVLHIRPVGDTSFFGEVPVLETTDVDSLEAFSYSKGVYRLVIPTDADLDTLIKYEIKFTIRGDPTEYLIDPYLKLPKQE